MSNTVTQDLFSQTYDDMVDNLYRHCFFRLSSKEKAEDIVQDTFAKFWKELHKGKTIEYPKAWLYRTAQNAIIDLYRKKTSVSLDEKQEENGFDAPDEKAHDDIEMNAEIRLVMDRVEKLSEDDREVIVLRYIDGLEVKEIAEIVGGSANAIAVRLHRAVTKLKQ